MSGGRHGKGRTLSSSHRGKEMAEHNGDEESEVVITPEKDKGDRVTIHQEILELRENKQMLGVVVVGLLGIIIIGYAIFLKTMDPTIGIEHYTSIVITGVLVIVGTYIYVHVSIVMRRHRKEIIKKLDNAQTRALLFFAALGLIIICFALFSFYWLRHPELGALSFVSIIIVGVLFIIGPYSYFEYYELSRIRSMETELPNFLRDIAEEQRSGKTLPQCFENAAKTDYGSLSDEIQTMASQLADGIKFPRVIEEFVERNKESVFIQQNMAINIEADSSDTDIADTLESVATNARLIKEVEMGKKVMIRRYMYIGHVIILVIIYWLNDFLKPLMGARPWHGPPLFYPGSFRTLFMNICYIEAIFNGLITGSIGEGSLVAGFKHSLVMLSMSFLLFAIYF